MEEGFEKNGSDREEIFSKSVRAGKRTYFFDVKSTKGNDYYLTITESKRGLVMMVNSFMKNTNCSFIRKILKNCGRPY
jgi:hypothetical protein